MRPATSVADTGTDGSRPAGDTQDSGHRESIDHGGRNRDTYKDAYKVDSKNPDGGQDGVGHDDLGISFTGSYGSGIRWEPEPRRFQSLWFGIALMAILPGIAGAYLYLLPPTDDAGSLISAFTPYGMIADLIALAFFGVVLARARRRLATAALTMVSALLLVLQLVWIAPQFVPDPRPTDTPPFTIMSLNMKFGLADVAGIRREATYADVVVLLEVTPAAYEAVRSALGARFPNVVPAGISIGNQSMILSRYPLTNAWELWSQNPQWSATTRIPGIGPVNVVAAHPIDPMRVGARWSQEHTSLLQRAEALNSRPEVIAGDFNATSEQGPIRTMGDHGFASATDIAGAGWLRTFPANGTVIPPLLDIDHVLVNDRLTALSIKTFRVADSDHLGLLARLAGTTGTPQ